MVETVGTQLRRARTAREISLEDAARATKIRSARLADLEADVYTNFPNLAYARGFLTSYGKYLAVDVRPYLDAFEDTSTFGVDDYQYLSEKPVGVYRAPRRVWRQRAPRRRLVALGSTLGLLLVTMFGWFLYVNYLRLGDLSKLAEHQDVRGRQPAELNPAAILARPIPSESPMSLIAASLEVTPAAVAPGSGVVEPAPLPAAPTPAIPTEMAMMDQAAPPAPVLAVSDPISAALTPAPAVDPESTATQLIENRAPTVRAALPVPAHRLSAHVPEPRPARVSFDTSPDQPLVRNKSFE